LLCLRNITFVVILLALIALVNSSQAQTIRIVGQVVDASTNLPVDGAVVVLIDLGQNIASDKNGFFKFENLSAGQYTISISHIAYSSIERRVSISPGKDDSIIVALKPALYQSDEVIVRSTRSLTDIYDSPYPLDVRLSDHLTQIPSTTIADALNKVPGIALVRDGSWQTAVSIRGMSRSNIVSLIDNTRIETANDIAGALSLININDLERVETLKSSSSVLYGTGALGGILHLVTKRPTFSEQPQIKAELTNGIASVDDGLSNYAAVDGSSDRFAMRLSGGYRSAGNTKTPNGVLPNSQYHDFSLTGFLGIRTFSNQSLFINYQRSQAEDTGIPGGSAFGATSVVRYILARRELISAGYSIPNVSPAIAHLSVHISRQEITRNVEIIQSPTVTVTPHAIHTTTNAQIESKIVPLENHLLIVGAEAWERELDSRREKNQKSLNKIVGERPIPSSKYFISGVFAQDEWNFLPDKLTLNVGARYDWIRVSNERTYNPEYTITAGVLKTNLADSTILWRSGSAHDESWSADFGIHYSLDPQLDLTFLAATAFRSPSLEERYQYLDLGNGLIQVGNPNLQPERSISLNAGIRFHVEGLKIQTDVFLNSLTNLIRSVQGAFSGQAALVNTNISKAQLYGYEFSLEKMFTAQMLLKVTAAYIRGEDTHSHANLPQIAPLNGYIELSKFFNGIGTANLSCSYFTEQGNLAVGEARTPGYAIFNVNYASIPLDIWRLSLTVRAGIQNVFDKAYRNHLSTLRGIIKDEPGRNFFLSATVAI
jgi:hemoglobin/transferrin/lactoferrin receptor protein